MKSNLRIISVVTISLLLALTFSCKKEVPKVIPSISTSAPTNITLSTATCGGAISADGGAPVTSRGVCWSVIQNPTTSDTKTSDGSGIGNFTSSISGLAPGTAYYMRAYATNSVGTAYGNQVVSTTISTLSTITTIAVVNITTTTATSGGTVSADGGAPVFSRGVCWSTSQNPTILNDRTNNGTGTGTFTSTIIGLNPGTTYYLRAYAANSPGTAYGTQISFTTGVVPVSAFTATPTTITAGQSILFTDESTNTPTSWSWNFGDGGTSTSQNPSHSYATAGTYTVALTSTNSFGSNTQTKTNYITVNIAGSSPVSAFTATPTTITAGQSVQFTDQSTNTPTSWSWNFGDGGTSTTKNPSHTYASAGTYTVSLTSTNSFGSNTLTKTNYITVNSVSGGIIFNPNLTYGSVTDIDGNVYKTILIGSQTWMAENLKTTKYRNGNLIGTTTPATLDIFKENTPKYQWAYAGNESPVATYGRLYTWYAATDSRNVCPTGWHLPTDTEWTTLTTFLGGESIAGGKLKEAGTSHWISPNTGATNTSGFTALPGGYRGVDGSFGDVGYAGTWWSSTEGNTYGAWTRTMNYYGTLGAFSYNYKETFGFSVRCLRD